MAQAETACAMSRAQLTPCDKTCKGAISQLAVSCMYAAVRRSRGVNTFHYLVRKSDAAYITRFKCCHPTAGAASVSCQRS